MADKRVEYTIGVKNEGLENLTRIIDELDKAGVETSEFKKQAELLRQQLAETARQQSLIDSFVKIKQEVGAAGTAMETAQAKAQQLGRELAATDAPTKKQTAEFGRARDAVNSTKDAYQAAQVRLQAMRGTLAENNIETTSLAQKQAALRNGVRDVETAVAGATTRLKDLGSAGPKAVNDTAKATDQAATSAKGYEGALTQVAQAMAGIFAANKLTGFAKSTIEIADAYGQMAERVKMATSSQGEFDMVQQRLLASANITYRALSEQQELYIRTSDALRSMAYSTEQVLDITDSFTYLLTTNAASVEKGKNAIDAYTKSIQSGKVEVDSWQSIMAATPTIVDAIAKSTGKTTEEVRKLGITGALSVKDLNEGLRQTVAINKEAAEGMSATVNDALTRLTNTWSAYIGEMNKANGYTKSVASLIDKLSENLGSLAETAARAGAVLTAALAVQGVQALRTLALEMATTGKAAALLSLDLSKIPKTVNIAVAATGFEVGWQIGTWARESFESVRKMGVGVVGYAQAVVSSLQLIKEASAAVFTSDTVDAAFDRFKQRNKALKDIVEGMWEDAKTAPSKIASAADAGSNSLGGMGTAGAAAGQAVAAGGSAGAAGVGQVGKAADDARGALSGLATVINTAAPADGFRDIVQNLIAAKNRAVDLELVLRKDMPAAIDKLSGPELAKFRADFIRAMDEAGIKGKAVETGLRLIGEQAAKSLGVDVPLAFNKTSKSFEEARGSLSVLIRSLPELKAAGIDAATVVSQALSKMIDGAKSKAEIDSVTQQVKVLRKELGDKVADGLLDQAKQKSIELSDALDKAKPGINSLREAMAELGLKSRDELELTAKKAQEAFAVVTQAGAAEGESYESWQRRKTAAAEVMLTRMIEANQGVATEAIKSRAAMEGLEVQTDATGKSIVKAMDGGKIAVDGLGQQVRATTEDMKAQAAAIDAINARYGQSEKDRANKYGRPGDDAAAQADERTKRLSGQNAVDNTLMFKLRDKGANLTAADIPELEAVLAAERKNDQMINNRLGGRAGLYSLDGLRDDSNWRQIKAQWQSFIDGEKNKAPADAMPPMTPATPANAPVRAPAPQPAQQQVSQPSQSGGSSSSMATHTVNINLNGAVSTVSTDANGAAALKGMLSQLAAARGSAAR